MRIFTRTFWVNAGERATKTAAQSAILAFGADQINVITVDWPTIGALAAGGAVLSILTSIGFPPDKPTTEPTAG